jgi:hypothetical protein
LKEKTIKVAKWGTPKKIFKKKKSVDFGFDRRSERI